MSAPVPKPVGLARRLNLWQQDGWRIARPGASTDDRPPPTPLGERERARAAVRDAGLLAELGPELSLRAEQSTVTLEEVHAAFARAGGKPLTEEE